MSDPQYGTQTVRFVETAQVAVTDEIDQFRVCQSTGATNPTTITDNITFPSSVTISNGASPATANKKVAVFGVTQQRLRAVPDGTLASEQNSGDNLRLVPVATSGNLLVEMDTATDAPLAVGDPLSVDTSGKASKLGASAANTPVALLATVNGTTPTVRSIVKLGPKQYALVSFT